MQAELSRDELLRPEVSVRLFRAWGTVLGRRYGKTFFDDVLACAGLPAAELRGSDGWISKAFVTQVTIEVVRRITGRDELPPYDHPVWQLWAEIGRQTVRPESLGPMYAVLRTLGAPGACYRQIPLLLNSECKLFHTARVDQSKGQVVFEMREAPARVGDLPSICWQTREGLGAIPTIWGLPPAQVEHPQCRFQGDPVCVYECHFDERSMLRALSPFMTGGAGMLAATGASALFESQTSIWGIAGFFAGVAIDAWVRLARHERDLRHDDSGTFELLQDANMRYAELWHQAEELRSTLRSNKRLSRYLPEKVVARLEAADSDVSLGGQELEVTVLFVDMEGYSPASEALHPSEVVQLLNAYFETMAAVVSQFDGTVIEYTGDGMLIVFGAPNELLDHAAAAVRCATAMHERLENLSRSYIDAGYKVDSWMARLSEVGMRCGIHSGTVVAGNIGVAQQMKYSVVGDTVNVAARLEQLNKSVRTRTLVSGSTMLMLPPELVAQGVPRGAHQVKGRNRPVDVYSFDGDRQQSPTRKQRWREDVDTDLFIKNA